MIKSVFSTISYLCWNILPIKGKSPNKGILLIFCVILEFSNSPTIILCSLGTVTAEETSADFSGVYTLQPVL